MPEENAKSRHRTSSRIDRSRGSSSRSAGNAGASGPHPTVQDGLPRPRHTIDRNWQSGLGSRNVPRRNNHYVLAQKAQVDGA